jgi:hypothetical protein
MCIILIILILVALSTTTEIKLSVDQTTTTALSIDKIKKAASHGIPNIHSHLKLIDAAFALFPNTYNINSTRRAFKTKLDLQILFNDAYYHKYQKLWRDILDTYILVQMNQVDITLAEQRVMEYTSVLDTLENNWTKQKLWRTVSVSDQDEYNNIEHAWDQTRLVLDNYIDYLETHIKQICCIACTSIEE